MLRATIIPIVQLLDSLEWDLFTWRRLSSLALGSFRLYRFDLALIETEIFGKLVVENSGGHYCKVKEAMSLVSEVMTVLMFEQFKADQDSTNCELDQQIETTGN